MSALSNPPLPFDDMIRLFSRSKLTLGFNELGHTHLLKRPLSTIRTRDFEAMASGACHFVLRMPGWESYYEEDRDVLCYGSIEELADKIQYYLNPRRDADRVRIRQNARERALQDNSWSDRFNKIFEALGIIG